MPIYKQIAQSIGKENWKGHLKKDFNLPSINISANRYAVARYTIERSNKGLRKQGYITSIN